MPANIDAKEAGLRYLSDVAPGTGRKRVAGGAGLAAEAAAVTAPLNRWLAEHAQPG